MSAEALKSTVVESQDFSRNGTKGVIQTVEGLLDNIPVRWLRLKGCNQSFLSCKYRSDGICKAAQLDAPGMTEMIGTVVCGRSS